MIVAWPEIVKEPAEETVARQENPIFQTGKSGHLAGGDKGRLITVVPSIAEGL